MAFTNLPPDLILPPGGSLTPGSGTVYIGGPQLPAAMSQFESAIVFYTDALGLSQGIDFWYLAHFGQTHAPFIADGVQIGFYPTGGPLTKSNIGAFVSSATGKDAVVIETSTGNINLNSARQLILNSVGQPIFIQAGTDAEISSAGGGLVYLASDFGNVSIRKSIASNTEIAEFRNLGTQPNVKALNSSTIDVWQHSHFAGTIGGVASSTVDIDWRQTIDWMVDFRFSLVMPSAPASMSFTTPVLTFPAPDVGVSGISPILAAVTFGTVSNGVIAAGINANNTISFFLAGNANGTVQAVGQCSYTLSKP